MSTYYLPFQGEVVDIASWGRRLLLAVRHPEGKPLHAWQVSAEDLLVMGAQMDALSPVGPAAGVSAVGVLGDEALFGTTDGAIYRQAEGSKDAALLAQVGAAVGGLSALVGDQILVRLPSAVALLDSSGAEKQRFSYDGDEITALAVEAGGERFAVGLGSGGIRLFFQRDGAFHESYLLDEEDEILEVLHERGVTAVAFVQDTDGQRQLITAGGDLKLQQAPIDEGRPMPREAKEMHSQRVVALVPGPHGRFYSLGIDKAAKTWTNDYSRVRAPSTALSAEPRMGICVDLPARNAQGRWEDQPHLLVSMGSTLLLLGIQNLDPGGETVDPSTLASNGQISGETARISGGVDFMQAMGAAKDPQLRKQVLQIVGGWGDTATVEFLAARASADEVAQLRLQALASLVASQHPRTVVLLEGILQNGKHTETRETAYKSLRGALGETSLRPMQLGLKVSALEVATRAAADLGERARAGDVAALELLKNTLSHGQYEVAAAAYDQLAGIGTVPPALPGVEGVLIGIRSTQAEVRRRAVARLKERDLINTLPAQVVLRRMREDTDEAMRERAFYVSLLGRPRLAELMRSDDEDLHRQLCDLELLGASTEDRKAAIANPPSGKGVVLDLEDEALLHEMSASQSADISALATITHARLGDIGSLPILLQLTNEKDARLRRRACRGLRYMLSDSMARQALEGLMLSDDDANVRLTAFDGVLIANLDDGNVLAPLRKALDSKHADLRKASVVVLQRYISSLLAQNLDLTYSAANQPPTQLQEEVALLQRALDDTTFDAHIAMEAYKTFYNNTLIGGTQESTLEHLLNNANRPVRQAAVKDTLTFMDEPWAVDLLIRCLDDNDFGFRHEIFDTAYPRLEGTPLESLFVEGALTGRHKDITRKAFRKVIASTGAWMTHHILAGLTNSDREIRELAISAQAVASLEANGKAHEHLTQALKGSDRDLQRRALALLNQRTDLINEGMYTLMVGMLKGRDTQVKDAVFGNGLWTWVKKQGREQTFLTDAYEHGTPAIQRTVMGWLRGMESSWAEALLQQAMTNRDAHISEGAFSELLQRNQTRGQAEAFLRAAFDKKKTPSSNIRSRALRELTSREAGWVEELLREALVDDDANVAQVAFNELLRRHRARGEEESFVTQAMKLNERLRRQAFGLVQSATGAWRGSILRDSLNNEDDYIRAMAIQEVITHDLPDDFLQSLLSHRYGDVQAAATEILARKGRMDLIRDRLSRILRQDKPSQWSWEASDKYQKRYESWKNLKITALKAAGEGNDESLYDDVRYVVDQAEGGGGNNRRGRTQKSEKWNEPGLRRLAVLQLGWVCSTSKQKDLADLFKRERDRDARYNAARAMANIGVYDGAKWLYDQNAASDHVIQALIAVGDEAEALMQRLMREKADLCGEALFAWMLRLAALGGPVEFLSQGLTSSSSLTRLFAARLFEVAHDKDRLLDRLVELLSDRDPFADDPFAKADIGADWYSAAKLLYEFYSREYPEDYEIPRADWRRLGMLFAHPDSRVRARAVSLLYRLRKHGLKQQEFQTELRQRADFVFRTVTLSPAPLTLNDAPLKEAEARALAMGSYVGLMRQPGNLSHRRQALRRLVDLSLSTEPRRAVPILQASMSGRVSELRRDAFGHLVRLSRQARRALDPENAGELGVELPVAELAEAAVHTEDDQLQQLAISLLWMTGDVTRIEELLRSRDDSAAQYAFLALYENQEDSRLAVLPIALSSGNGKIRSLAVEKLVAELQRRRTEKEDDTAVLALLRETLSSPYPELVRKVAILAAQAKEPAGMAVLQELLASHIQSEQKQAVEALVALGAEGTAVMFMDRADTDQTGSVDRNLLFKGVQDLKDTSAPVLGRLFELVSQGPSDPEYDHAIKTLLHFSGHASPVSESARWAQLSEKDQEKARETYDDALLGRLLEALYDHSHPQTVSRYRLLNAAKTAWGGGADAALRLWALIPDTAQNQALKQLAIDALAWRYENREASSVVESALLAALDLFGPNKVISNYQYTAAAALGRAGFKSDGRVFTYLRRIAVNATDYSHAWRKQAVQTLGQMADLRAVESLLNIAGYDEQGQRIPKEQSGWQETELELAALEALGQMSRSPLAGAFFQALSDGARRHDERFAKASVKGLGFFGDHAELAEPAFQVLQKVQTGRFRGFSQDVLRAMTELWRRTSDAALRSAVVDELLVRLEGNDRSDMEVAYDALKEAASSDDLRPQEVLLRHAQSIRATNDAMDRLAEAAEAGKLFGLIRDARKDKRPSDRVQRLTRGLMARRPVPVAEAMVALKEDIREETSHVLHEALDIIAQGAESMDAAGKAYIVETAALLRTSWAEARDLRDRGFDDKAARMKELEPIWERLVSLCGVLQTGTEELAAALVERGAPLAMQRKALLSVEGSPSAPSDAIATLFREGQRSLRSLIAASLKGNEALTASLIADAQVDAGSLRLLVGSGSAASVAALRVEAQRGSALALQELARLGDVAGLTAVLDAASAGASANAPAAADHPLLSRVLQALGATGLAAAEERLAAVGQSENYAPALRRLAWNARRRSQRIRARNEKHSAEITR